MFPWKKAKDKEDKSKRRDDKKAKPTVGDGRRRHLVISGPLQARPVGGLLSPTEEDVTDRSASPMSEIPLPPSGSVSLKKPPPVPPKKPAVARTLSVPKSRLPERPAPRSTSLTAQPLDMALRSAVRNGTWSG